MKICPVCDERYDEEIIKFCTKDGTPLVEEDQPNFTALPSESADDFGEETIIRRKPLVTADEPKKPAERIVIPTSGTQEQQVRPRTVVPYYPPPPESNTAKTVVLTILGTLVVLGFGAFLFWILRGDTPVTNVNTNINSVLTNQNTNLNSNGFDSNFNFNTNANYSSNYNTNFNLNTNLNTNLNANMRSPTPTPKPKPSPTPTPIPANTATPEPTARPTPNRPSASPTPRNGPRPPTMTSNRPANGN